MSATLPGAGGGRSRPSLRRPSAEAPVGKPPDMLDDPEKDILTRVSALRQLFLNVPDHCDEALLVWLSTGVTRLCDLRRDSCLVCV